MSKKNNSVFIKVRAVVGTNVRKIAEKVMRDGERVLKIVVLGGQGNIAYVTKERVSHNGNVYWRDLGAYLP